MARDPIDDIADELTGRVVQLPQRRLVKPRGVIGTGSPSRREGEPGMKLSRRVIVADTDIGLGQIENLRANSIFRDEVDAYLDAKGDAAVGPNGEPLDEFYTRVQLQQHQQRDATLAAETVSNPPSAFRSSPAALSNVITLTPKAGAAVIQQNVVYWQGEGPETGPVTITLSPVDSNIWSQFVAGQFSSLGAPLRPFAIIHWGSFGTLFQVQVDIGRGVQFTVHASTVAIDLAIDGYPPALQPNPTPAMTMQASLSFKHIARPVPLIRTIYGNVDANTGIAAGGNKTYYLPPFSSQVLPVQMSDLAGSVQISLLDATNTVRYTAKFNNGAQTFPIPLMDDMTQIDIKNTGAGAQFIWVPIALAI